MFPIPGQVIISVWNSRAAVSRYERVDGGITVVEASNWQELEADALMEVEDQDAASNISGHYSCSNELADRAVFPSN